MFICAIGFIKRPTGPHTKAKSRLSCRSVYRPGRRKGRETTLAEMRATSIFTCTLPLPSKVGFQHRLQFRIRLASHRNVWGCSTSSNSCADRCPGRYRRRYVRYSIKLSILTNSCRCWHKFMSFYLFIALNYCGLCDSVLGQHPWLCPNC